MDWRWWRKLKLEPMRIKLGQVRIKYTVETKNVSNYNKEGAANVNGCKIR